MKGSIQKKNNNNKEGIITAFRIMMLQKNNTEQTFT